MEIRVAKTAGFCFGVNRAVELTYGLLAEGHRVATLGPLIHNPQAVEDMQRKGAQVVDTVQDVPAGYEVVIRSHGVPRSVYDELTARGIHYHDATCPFVQKILRIAAEAEKAGAVLLVAGDKTHPEVQGIVGHTRGEVFVFADLAELKAWKGPSDPQKPLFAVAQTTFQVTKWQESSELQREHLSIKRIVGIIGQLAQLDKAGLLRSDIHLDLVGRDAGHDSFHNTACMNTLFLGCIQHLLKAHAVIDFCAHTVKYLLNNRRWR